MKNSIQFLFMLFAFAMLSTSCKKQLVDQYQNNQQTYVAKSTSGIKAAANFKWNTSQNLTVGFTAVPNDARVSVLKVIAPDGSVIYKKLQKANEAFSVNLALPTYINKVEIDFGGNKKSYDIKSGKVDVTIS